MEKAGGTDRILQFDELPEVYHQLFSDMDLNRDKQIDEDELYRAFKQHNIHIRGITIPKPDPEPLPEQQKNDWHWTPGTVVGQFKIGGTDWDERDEELKETISEIFGIDANEDGALQIDEIPEEYHVLFSDVDTNRNKQIEFVELFDIFKRHGIRFMKDDDVSNPDPAPKEPELDWHWTEGTVIGDLQIGGLPDLT